MKKTRVLLADDHTIVAEGLVSLLEQDFELVGRVDNGRDLLKKAEELSPDVIVTDISMPLLNGIEALRQLKKTKPDVRVVFLTVHADVSYITEAFRAGAAGYVLKQSAAEELRSAIKAVHEGRTYLTPLITKDFLNDILNTDEGVDSVNVTLTPREREVLQLLAEGHAVKEIGAVLDISPRTVEFHKYNIMEKLGLRTTAELTQYAIKHGVVSV
ncbi:MAG: response regulator transcription factor [Acidobacteria bacterium]|nr:MAG: response regulator transcription factor [Acidobacteriota bacterium]